MRRRLLLGAAALVAGAAPSWLRAQPRAAHKIGYLHPRTVAPTHSTRIILSRAWRQLGYAEGDGVLLRSADDDVRRLPGLAWDPSTGTDQLEVAKVAARGKGFDALVLELHGLRTFDAALKPLGGSPRTGIVQLSSPGFAVVVARFAAAARRHRIPVIVFLKSHVRDGLLMSYGPIQEQYFPRAVALADRILKGAIAGELPIEAPDRFELAINQATAHAIGVTIPPSLLLRADEVIG